MSRLDPAALERITGTAEKWRRRCNGQPADGLLTDAATLRVMLASNADVNARSDGVITWRADGREFTAEPVQDDADI